MVKCVDVFIQKLRTKMGGGYVTHSLGCGVATPKPSALIISSDVGVMSMHLLGASPRHRG